MDLVKGKFYVVSDTCGNYCPRRFLGLLEEYVEHKMPAGPWISNGNKTFEIFALFSSEIPTSEDIEEGGVFHDFGEFQIFKSKHDYLILARPHLSKYVDGIVFETVGIADNLKDFTKKLTYKFK